MKLSNQNICNLRGCQMPLGGGGPPPKNDLHPPSPPPPKAFGTPANYIYFDLIVSLFENYQYYGLRSCHAGQENNFVKHFPWPFRALPPRPGQSRQQQPPRYLSTPPNENMKIRLCYICCLARGLAINPLRVGTRFDTSIDNNVNILYIYKESKCTFSFIFVCVAISFLCSF